MNNMVKFENECVGCPSEMGCMGDSCPNRNVKRFYCDKCGYECEELYIFNDKELCRDCLLDSFDKITL